MFEALAAAALAAALTAAVPSTNSHWLKRPSDTDYARFTPPEAARRQISGGAIIKCAVEADGHLDKCQVEFEAPEGLGFGDAAIHLYKLFRMNPSPTPGLSASSTVTVPITFDLQGPDSPQAILISRPLWTSAPTFEEVREADDKIAGGAVGAVDLRCRVNSAGRIALCRTLPLAPPTLPKGETMPPLVMAALTLSHRFQFVPPAGVGAGQPLVTDLRIRFAGPDDPDFKAHRIGQPDWLTFIDPTAAIRLFPPEAAAKGLKTGRGVAECRVASDGRLVDCRPQAGDPDGVGFSEAAVKIASAMRMSLWTPSGGPVDGADVRIPVRFNLAPTPTPPTPMPAPR